MSDPLSSAGRRLVQVKDLILGKTQDPNNLPWDPNSTSFPLRKDLPKFPGVPDDAAWVWGRDDFRGRLNLLTPTRVKAASAEIKTGEALRLDLPMNVPAQPSFSREKFEHKIKTVVENICYDDLYQHLNTQVGTQWDGFRHFAHVQTQLFYNNAKGSDFVGPDANDKCSIHHWSAGGGFAGRAVLLDYRAYAEANNIVYDTATSHAISYSDLVACGQYQGIDIRPQSQGGDIQIGDILLIRSGFVKDYYNRSAEANQELALRKEENLKWAGLAQESAILDWLHDSYFAAVAGDAPSFECWPAPAGSHYMHEYILALWGMPLGEMLDLEKVSEVARKNKRWTFFFTSAPANCVGGVASTVNGTAIF